MFKLWRRVAWSSRRKFNLTVSAETLIYQIVVSVGKSLNGHLRSGGELLEYMGQAYEYFNILRKISKAHVEVRAWWKLLVPP